MATYLLVHGAWHGAWCWELLVPALEARGHRAVSIDLPGMGADTTPAWRVSLRSYGRAVVAAARACDEPVIAVGHSMGGIAITEAAAQAAEHFSLLVFLAALVPQPGQSMLGLVRADPESGSAVGRAVRLRPTQTRLDPERAVDAFFNTTDPGQARAAAARLVGTPNRPMFERASATPDALPRAYIECALDRALPVGFQRRMHAAVPMARVVTLETDHSPFLCAPEPLAEALDAMAGLARCAAGPRAAPRASEDVIRPGG